MAFTNDEVMQCVVEFTDRRIMQEFEEQRFMDGFLPFTTFVADMRSEFPNTDSRWSIYLHRYLEQRVSEGTFEYQGGFVIGYRVNI